MTVIDRILAVFDEHGRGAHFGENVTETEHALQCAHMAATAGADDALVAAALLHDVGHLLHGLPEDIAERGTDGRHEVGGAAWLAGSFGPAVVAPVRLHVAAKRYLCAVEPAYHGAMSAASQRSLLLQGGPMSPAEMRLFVAEPWFRSPAGLKAGLWSPTELAVDPRQVIAALPAWLAKTHGVEFAFGTPVLGFDGSTVTTPDGGVPVKRLVICTGADFRDLAPAAFAASGLYPCKLQMMRSQAFGDRFRVGTHSAAGLTLRHYASFKTCPTLPALARRLDAEMPEYGRYGIHVLVSQNAAGELTLGDTHEYGDAITPFDNPRLDDLVLDYLKTFLAVPDPRVAERWHGVYVRHPTAAYVAARPAENTLAVTGVGGAGMTLSFGLAEKTISDFLGEAP